MIIKSYNKGKDYLLNTIIHLILHIRRKWTRRQTQIINYLETNVNATQTQAAKHFNMSKQAISKTVKTTAWKEINKAEKIVDKLLSKPNLVNSPKSTIQGCKVC